MKKLITTLLIFALMLSLAGCFDTDKTETVDIQILATSDIHGRIYPFDYSMDMENTSGSVAQIATVINEKRTDNTLVFDAGDMHESYIYEVAANDEVNPMAVALNEIGYDGWTTGNHEYDQGIEELKDFVSDLDAPLLLGNVWDENGDALAQPYAVFERNGIKIGVIGMVTPNITIWDRDNLKNCTVTDPGEECKKAIAELQGKADILVGLFHMDTENECNTPGSGVKDLVSNCPEFDVVIAAHGHNAIEGETIGNTLVVENKNLAQTMSEIHIIVEKTKDGCNVIDKSSRLIDIKEYEPDQNLMDKLQDFHERVIDNYHTVIGYLEGGNLTPENETPDVPQALLEDTALLDFVNKVQLYYAGTDVSATILTNPSCFLNEGEIRKCDITNIYKYVNTICKLQMTGKQLKQYMEWSARFYKQYEDGDVAIAFNPDIKSYNYDVFAGVFYDINIKNPEGSRIENLTWMDKTPVNDEDVLTIAVNNYRADSYILIPGVVFDEQDMPVLLEKAISYNNISDLRDLIKDYIINVSHGVITPEVDNNWKVVVNN